MTKYKKYLKKISLIFLYIPVFGSIVLLSYFEIGNDFIDEIRENEKIIENKTYFYEKFYNLIENIENAKADYLKILKEQEILIENNELTLFKKTINYIYDHKKEFFIGIAVLFVTGGIILYIKKYSSELDSSSISDDLETIPNIRNGSSLDLDNDVFVIREVNPRSGVVLKAYYSPFALDRKNLPDITSKCVEFDNGHQILLSNINARVLKSMSSEEVSRWEKVWLNIIQKSSKVNASLEEDAIVVKR